MKGTKILSSTSRLWGRRIFRFAAACSIFLSAGFSATANDLDHNAIGRADTVIFDLDSGDVKYPELWNPYIPRPQFSQGLGQALIEPLFVLNYETGTIIPWLAESYSHNDASDIWTIRLKDGIEWSDGEAMDAEDLAFTLDFILNTPGLSHTWGIDQWVDSVTILDRLSVEIRLKKSNPYFLLNQLTVQIYSSITVLPEHIWKDKDPFTFSNYDPEKGWPVFTGPYQLAQKSPSRFVYTRNDNWWGAKAGFKPLPEPKKLIWINHNSEESSAAAMINHDLDSLMDVNFSTFSRIRRHNPAVISHYDKLPFTWPDPCPRSLEFNTVKAPFDDPAMRWAINHAINRSEIVVKALNGTTTEAFSIFPPYQSLNRFMEISSEQGIFDRYPIREFNVRKTREIIESLGYSLDKAGEYYQKDGKLLALHIQTPQPYTEKQAIAQNVVEQLRQASIYATMGVVDHDAFFSNYATGDFQARIGWQSCGSVGEPWSSFESFNASFVKPLGEATGFNEFSGQNGWRWDNKVFSAHVDGMASARNNAAEIEGLFVKALDVWMQELPIIPLTQAKKLIPFDTTYWENWPTASNPYIQPPTWWQTTHLILHNLRKNPTATSSYDRDTLVARSRQVADSLSVFTFPTEGEYSGMPDKVMRLVFDELELAPEKGIFPWSRAYDATRNKSHAMMYPLERLPGNKDDFKWVGALNPINTYLYKWRGNSDITVEDFADLPDYNIGFRLNGGWESYLKSRRNTNLFPVSELSQSIKMLRAKRIDLILGSEYEVNAALNNLGMSSGVLERVLRIDELSTHGYLAFNKDTPDQVVDIFRRALAKVYARGGYHRILDEYWTAINLEN